MDFISLPSQKVPVAYRTEVVVLGGGPAGISAAISSARNGADTLLLERYGFLGGQATGGLVIILCGLNDRKERIIKGYCQEVIDYLESFNATKDWYGHYVFEPELLKRCFDEHIKLNKVKLLFHAFIVDSIVEEDSIKYIIIESKSGRQAIEAKVVVDCTGDADTLKWCNEDFEQFQKEKAMHVTACFRAGGVNINSFNEYMKTSKEELIENFKHFGEHINPTHLVATVDDNFVWFDMSHINNIDITSVDDLTQAELDSRKLSWELFEAFKEKVSGFEKAYMLDIAPLLGVRDSRRLKGQYFITQDDYNKDFEDTICFFPYYFDKEGIGKLQVPYRALVPKRIKNLLVAGRAVGIEHKLLDCMREIAQCFATGQAAGTAASIAVKDNLPVSSIDIKTLRKILVSQGAYINT